MLSDTAPDIAGVATIEPTTTLAFEYVNPESHHEKGPGVVPGPAKEMAPRLQLNSFMTGLKKSPNAYIPAPDEIQRQIKQDARIQYP